ncbi:AIPR family protein (plasmid) [Streptomyces sp. BHT-5-2]|uniref:AIPR family protein n=1 Tax=Streptomyces sp. BHT-5-2 TaxID=2866715 RepID=UPI001C8DF10A|nr:AIPR family protein [Streptomyces sp. BHT-5-2]QZL08765.1 AIPR family protein [Streptomyces sp. BHT-5-2]
MHSSKHSAASRGRIPDQVRQVAKALDRTYPDLIDISDYANRPDWQRSDIFRTRALAAHAVRIVTDWSAQDAALTVIDGGQDQGIDALAVDRESKCVYLVQSKWSEKGQATAKLDVVHKLFAGLSLIDSEEFGQFNPRGRALAEQAKKLMGEEGVTVVLVFALMGAEPLSSELRQALDNGAREFNHLGEIVDHRVILASELHAKVRDDIADKPLDLKASLTPWFSLNDPYESYEGVVPAEEVAEWAKAGNSLFARNIRNPLGLTSINNELVATLNEEPAHFWYFNNGITILCDSVEKTYHSRKAPWSGPLTLKIHGASVVNGAQTVRAIADAVTDEDSGAYAAQVNVRVIVTGDDTEFAGHTTRATNRQNSVGARDLVALDPVQAALIEEMQAEFGLEYSVRRGELDPMEEAGCSVVEAACALACAHPGSQYAARIADNLDVLWERGSQGMYEALFRPQPSVFLLWNAVRVLRAVRTGLKELRKEYSGRAAAVIDHGTYLIAHLVFRQLRDADGAIEEPPAPKAGRTWADNALAEVPSLLRRVVPALIMSMDAVGERSRIQYLCADAASVRELVTDVLDTLAGGPITVTSLPDKYLSRPVQPRKRRRPNAVHVLVDQGAIPDGTLLTLHTYLAPEKEALKPWLAANERRTRATWVNHRTKPILWSADGNQYSPSGLIARMWELAEWEERPVSNQGTARWLTPDGETLADLAWRLLESLEDEDDEE